MSPEEARSILGCVGITQVALAKVCGVDPRTVRKWLSLSPSSQYTIPPSIATLLRTWQQWPDTIPTDARRRPSR